MNKVITKKNDLTYLKWSHARSSSGTAGTFLKSQTTTAGENSVSDLRDIGFLLPVKADDI